VGHSIFFYTDSRMLGGAERAMMTLIESLERDTWRPTLVLDDVPTAAALAQQATALDVPVWRISPMPLGLVGLRRVPSLARSLRAERPDVFHAHLSWPLAAKYPMAAAVAARVPAVVATVHLIPQFTVDHASLLQLRALSAGVGRYIAVSHDIAIELTEQFRWPQRKIDVIHNGVWTDRFQATPSPELRTWLTGGRPGPIVFTCARLDPQKGHSVLLQAAAKVPQAVFVLAGEGPLRPELEAQAAALGVPDRVRFLGFRTDIPELLAASDVFALPSLYEGTSLAVLEAMAAGRAIVSSMIGGTDELIEHGDSGLLVAPGDVDALVDSLRRLLADEGLRAALGRRAHERARREFSPAAMADRVTRIYEELIANASGR
jgi:glycosyltransferase involved in cell wall biosynthesis